MIRPREVDSPGRWLLMGGAGYIGSHVAHAILDQGGEVVVVDDLSSGEPARLPSEIPVIISPVTAEGSLLGVLGGESFDVILHFASLKNARASMTNPLAYWESVVGGTVAVLRIAREMGVGSLVYASSCAVYGNQAGVTEDTHAHPVSPYGAAKLASERVIRDASTATGLRATILRYFNVIGQGVFPHANDVSAGHLIPDMMQHISLGQPLSVAASQEETKDGTCLRDFVDVRDVAEAHVLAGRRLQSNVPSSSVESYNLSTGRPASTLEVVRLLAAEMGHDADVSVGDASPGDPASIYGAPARKAARELGWTPRYSLRDSIVSLKTGESQKRSSWR